jgi:hypothetical protein
MADLSKDCGQYNKIVKADPNPDQPISPLLLRLFLFSRGLSRGCLRSRCGRRRVAGRGCRGRAAGGRCMFDLTVGGYRWIAGRGCRRWRLLAGSEG